MPVLLDYSPNAPHPAVHTPPHPVLQHLPYQPPRFPGHPVLDEPSVVGQHAAVPPAPGQVPLPAPTGGGGIPAANYGLGDIPGRGMGRLSWNPQLILPDTALAQAGALDSQYASDKNAAMTDFYSKYHDVLKKLGYVNDQGIYVGGSIDQNFATQHQLGTEALGDEERQNTESAQDLGTLFSGVRVRNLLDAQRQTVRDLADLDVNTEGDTLQGYTDLGDIRATFNQAIQQAIANAIYRKTGSFNYNFTQPQQ